MGRDAERAEIRERLRSSRLVTVLGPGGVGKTAVALDVAAGMAPSLADGAVVVDLAGAAEGSEVGDVVATTIGVSETVDGDPLQQAVAALAGRDLLVVLDNCEHVVTEVARVAVELLRSSPTVRVMATSQERLRVVGEAVVAIEPLDVPDEGAGRDQAERSASCQLLAQRLEAIGRSPVGDDDWLAVAAVARGAGGLPLALEVAAAWAGAERMDVVASRLAGDDVLRAEPPIGAGARPGGGAGRCGGAPDGGRPLHLRRDQRVPGLVRHVRGRGVRRPRPGGGAPRSPACTTSRWRWSIRPIRTGSACSRRCAGTPPCCWPPTTAAPRRCA